MAENTKKRLTANEARELSGPTVDEQVDAALEIIRAAAMKKERRAHLHGAFWESDRTKEYSEAKAILESLGYKVSFFYEERQFVDVYTVVEW